MGKLRDRVKSGLKAAETNRAKHGEDFYQRINSMSHLEGHTGGFASQKVGKDGLTGRERARLAGSKGGKKSRRQAVCSNA